MRYHEEPLRLVCVCVRVLEMRAAECIGRQQTYEDAGRIIQHVCVFGMSETKPLNEEAVPNAERNRQHEGKKKNSRL